MSGGGPGAPHERPISVRLARSGRVIQVPADRPILDVLLDAGIDVPFSCRDGVCGTCLTAVLEGVPDHRDQVLFGADRDANDAMTVCVSRCLGDSLTLDL